MADEKLYHSLSGEITELDTTGLPISPLITNIDQYTDNFGLLRKMGLGGSDSGAIMGVSPYTTRKDLIAEKLRPYLTEEEQHRGGLSAVRKGVDLEPLIIYKAEQAFNTSIMKPNDMYVFDQYPYLTMNFDGVMEQPWEDHTRGTSGKYISMEIKVLTYFGEKHYDKSKAFYSQWTGWSQVPERIDLYNASIDEKSAMYGIPPYYYTQAQVELMALGEPPYCYLTLMAEKDWNIYSWWIWRDEAFIEAYKQEATKVWTEISQKRGPNWTIPEIENIPEVRFI